MGYTVTTQRELRRRFWAETNASRKIYKGDYCTDTRVAFCDFIDRLYRNGEISEALAHRARRIAGLD